MRHFGMIAIASLVVSCCLIRQASAQADVPAKRDDAIRALRAYIEKEVALKRVPALTIAVVEDNDVWIESFGDRDADKHTLAGPKTVYRVGSVSKPITALLLMLYVEQGKIDLDAPIETYLSDFKPVNKSDKKITLRQVLSHRSGLVREPALGGYFDDTKPTLEATVKSLNGMELVYEPESLTSYSNAAPCISGLILERLEKKPFPQIMKEKLFDPLGMTDSEVELTDRLKSRLPKAVMATYHGREFPAPLFDLATTPAGNIFSTAVDQAKLLSMLMARGKGPNGQFLKPETLDSMWKIQFKKEGDKAGFGLAFMVNQFEGRRTIGHSGAVYGYATEFVLLPEAKLGVFVCASRDVANGLTRHIAEVAVRSMLAVQDGKPLPVLNHTEALDAETAKSLVGTYRNAGKRVEITASDGHVYIFPPREGIRFEIRRFGKSLVVDDPLMFGPPVKLEGDTLTWKNNTYKREAAPELTPIPVHWEKLVGEYGPEHNHLTILEKDGSLCALIEWAFLYPLKEVNEDVFKFPDYGLYHGHEVKFIRDKTGRATAALAANYRFDRIPLPKPGETFKITPVRPVDELRKIAVAAEPPIEKNSLMRKPELVDITKLDGAIKLDIRYATDNNFLGTPFYTSARALLQKPAAEALVRVNKKLEKQGFGLLVHDAYRPWHVTKMFFDATPPRHHGFVADPSKGSRHNRGCAVDLTMYDRETGLPVEMVSSYDEFSDRSYPDYLGGTTLQRKHRDILRAAMESEGFTVFPAEWWHFDFADWREYPILNVRFEDLK